MSPARTPFALHQAVRDLAAEHGCQDTACLQAASESEKEAARSRMAALHALEEQTADLMLQLPARSLPDAAAQLARAAILLDMMGDMLDPVDGRMRQSDLQALHKQLNAAVCSAVAVVAPAAGMTLPALVGEHEARRILAAMPAGVAA